MMSSDMQGQSNIKAISINTYPSAKAPDHWSKKPRTAEAPIAAELWRLQSKESIPGGSSAGIIINKKNKVTGVVFHINLHIMFIKKHI